MFEYKCAPMPAPAKTAAKKADETAAASFADLLNEYGEQGWEFQSIEQITVEQKTGLFGMGKPKQEARTLVVFRRVAEKVKTVSGQTKADIRTNGLTFSEPQIKTGTTSEADPVPYPALPRELHSASPFQRLG